MKRINPSDGHSYTDFGALVRYCGKDQVSGKPLFADADTWIECSVSGDGLELQNATPVDPTTEGWPKLVA